jgi:hypothetical protein
MKNQKLTGFFILGFLAVFLSACFNPITAIPPKSGDPVTDPFTVDILIGKDGSARTVAGPDSARIKSDIRNVIQLVVTDDAGHLIAFDEDRRESDTDQAASLAIDSITFGQTYHFLILIGHWERDFPAEKTGGGDYVYKEDTPPTLLAAGLKDLLVTGSGKITVVMWPIVVDTTFHTPNTGAPSPTTGPAVTDGKPGKVGILPVDWSVTWTVKQGATGNGFTELVRAQKIKDSQAGNELLVRSKKTIARGTGFTGDTVSDAALSGTEKNTITLPITPYTSGIRRIGTSGSVNFRLEYVPFNLTDPGEWSTVDDTVFNLEETGPVWIIRNGVNDLAQDEKTDFNNLGKSGHTDPDAAAFANGNGAVFFEAAADEAAAVPEAGDLVIRNGIFVGSSSSTTPEITFITEGYGG